MARAVEQHKTKPAKRTSRQRSRSSQNNPSKTEPSPWLLLNDLFRRWRARLESSQETVGELWDLLRDPETRSAFVSGSCLFGGGVPPPGWVAWLPPGPASLVVLSYFYAGAAECGKLWPLDGEFWRDDAHLKVVPDADGVGDRLEVRRPTYVNADGPFSDSPGGTFLVRRVDVEHWEAALPPAPTKEPTPLEKYKRYTTDDDLVVEGVNGIRSRTWSNSLQAAKALAHRAKGSSRDSTVDRLRKKIGAALED
jgi:hypothetical protein